MTQKKSSKKRRKALDRADSRQFWWAVSVAAIMAVLSLHQLLGIKKLTPTAAATQLIQREAQDYRYSWYKGDSEPAGRTPSSSN